LKGERIPLRRYYISNGGTGKLEWEITENCSWLNVEPLMGSTLFDETDEVAVSIDISSLSGGEYGCELTITDPDATNSPQVVQVSLTITELNVLPEEGFESIGEIGGPFFPGSKEYTLTNMGDEELRWGISWESNWFDVSDAFGSLDPDESVVVTVYLTAEAEQLGEGDYYDKLKFTNLDTMGEQIRGAHLRILGEEEVLLVPHEYPTIQSAIDAAHDGDVVIVDVGTYVENINFGGKNIVLTSTNPDDWGVVAATVIDGGGYSVVKFAGSETTECVLKGFTITGGGHTSSGGGIYGNGTVATISNCIITGNRASLDEYVYGGGLSHCDGKISNCIITGNLAEADEYVYGGGLAFCDGTIINCTITGNTAPGGGGLYRCDAEIRNCIVASNKNGGLYKCDGMIKNCTITGNTYSGLSVCDGMINNCIIWDGIYNCSANITYSDVAGGWSGVGNIDEDPLFVDAAGGDYHLRWDSPCVDAGDPDFIPEPGEVDIDGEPRVIGGRVDMGADEVGEKQADFTRDGRIDISDLAVLSGSWETAEGEVNWYVLSDLFEDGVINISDLAAFVEDWMWVAEWVE
jgi:hypothetical protein